MDYEFISQAGNSFLSSYVNMRGKIIGLKCKDEWRYWFKFENLLNIQGKLGFCAGFTEKGWNDYRVKTRNSIMKSNHWRKTNQFVS